MPAPRSRHMIQEHRSISCKLPLDPSRILLRRSRSPGSRLHLTVAVAVLSTLILLLALPAWTQIALGSLPGEVLDSGGAPVWLRRLRYPALHSRWRAVASSTLPTLFSESTSCGKRARFCRSYQRDRCRREFG